MRDNHFIWNTVEALLTLMKRSDIDSRITITMGLDGFIEGIYSKKYVLATQIICMRMMYIMIISCFEGN